MTARRRGDGHRMVRWVWTSRSAAAKVVRAGLLPASALWWSGMALRRLAYRKHWFAVRTLPLPSIAVGNLTVGGSGKTPIASWIAAYLVTQGRRPAVLLRGVGGDEAEVHRDQVPAALVVSNPDRYAGAVHALAAGADILVLDDAYQRLDVARDLNICLVSAESSQAVRWPLVAGPWREGLGALDRADQIVVTRKRADASTAARFAAMLGAASGVPVAIARLELAELRGLVSGKVTRVDSLQGKRVVAASAIADPDAFVAQIKRTGAQVQVATWKDHHLFRDEDVAWLAHASRRADAVVMTAKDAVKLRGRWPASVPEPLVAILEVQFEAGETELRDALDRLVARQM